MDDKSLLQGLQKGEREAYKQVYKKLYPMVRTFVLKNRGNEEDAQDIFQEGLIALMQNIRVKGFKLTSKLSTYLYSIVRYKWLDKQRRKKDIDSIDDTYNELVDEGDLVLEKQKFEEKYSMVTVAIKSISDDCQKLLKGFYFKKLSMAELAEQLGYTVGFTKVKKNRCMNSLREKLVGKAGRV